MHATDALREADRLMTVCNACRYCQNLCAVFPAMELRRTFSDGDLDYLANLCHACGACYYDCQYAPPHEFAIDVPKIFALLREESYARHAWPRALSGVFARNGLLMAAATALGVAAFLIGFIWTSSLEVLFAAGTEEGAFYAVMPHAAMVALFGAAFLYAILACVLSLRQFWRMTGAEAAGPAQGSLWRALADVMTLRYLDGGGAGCMNEDERPTDRRRLFHHFTFYGFLLCFASTCVATMFHYGLGWPAPYGWSSPPVVLGALGGIGLLIGPAGLLAQKWRRDPALTSGSRTGMDVAFLLMLLLTSLTGLLLLVLRATPAMGLLLALHLGVVLALFLSSPYGKFVHGIYRFAALLRYARERRRAHKGPEAISMKHNNHLVKQADTRL